jgi:hypothetical protein
MTAIRITWRVQDKTDRELSINLKIVMIKIRVPEIIMEKLAAFMIW